MTRAERAELRESISGLPFLLRSQIVAAIDHLEAQEVRHREDFRLLWALIDDAATTPQTEHALPLTVPQRTYRLVLARMHATSDAARS